ncbi:MAG: DNA polymerase III subunit alpha, partial [Betaproteobacteria bacterium]|nr:DNA polymerase III subunit alpha [Betaproteobacteria bacterium]
MTAAAANPFVHLRLHSEFSITDGIVRIDDAVAQAVEDGMGALALTDLNNLFGLIRFYTTARSNGIKPISGCDVWIAAEENCPAFRVLLLARNHEGYLALCRLLSRAWRTGQERGVATIRRDWLEAEGAHLIVLSGAAQGDVGLALAAGNLALAQTRARHWNAAFPDAYYLELQRTGAPGQEAQVQATLHLAAELGIPVVATHPIQFLRPDDFKAHEARVCIAGGYLLADPRRPKTFTREQYFKTGEEMATLFADVPEALQNAVEIAKRCNLELTLGKPRLPDFPTPPGVTLDDYMVSLAREGLASRLERLYPDPELRRHEQATYQARLDFECQTIIQMGFSGYFLIVADFINWAKQHDVPVGPGRGSGAGSLVAYCLGITDLDPLRYDLLFERFLNPERVSMPDFDVDFCQDGRDRVIEYVRENYGADSVSQIVTFGTMAAKAVIRDVGRVLDLPYNFVDQLAKLVPFEIGMTLAKAREQEPQINQRAESEEEVAELLALAEKLEGITRTVGMHAGGVLIAPGQLTDFTPLYCQDGSEAVVSQFDKDDVEKVGLVKFDFLGLRTLTILDWAERYIRAMPDHPEAADFRLSDIPLDDPATYALFGSGNTTAVFQQESRTAKDLEKRLKPDSFEDIIALMALNRPGPLQSGMVDDFINRKQGRAKAEYFHQSLEPVLRPTYGVIVYQEQVMQIAQVLAGYTLGGADLLRRAMGKKNAAEMAQQRTRFIEGATERGIAVKLATQLFDLMEKFAEYGFNKSHSAAYALVSYQTAWLKAHYPAAFMAATLSGDPDDTDKVAVFVEDARRNGLVILPPDVNASQYRFVPVNDREIRYGLGSVKGTGESAAIEIERQREAGGPYRDLFDFCLRTDKRVVNRRVVEALVKAGAFDSLGEERATLLASMDDALELAEQAARHTHQGGLFGGEAETAVAPVGLTVVPPWPLKEKLAHEKSVLGFYFSGHPFAAYRREVEGFVSRALADLVPQPDPVVVAGVVAASRIQQTRRGRMGLVVLDDGTAKVEVAIFSELFDTVRPLLKEDQVLVVEG